MTLTPEQKQHAIELIEMGDKLGAVRYFQEILSIDAEQALILAEKLQEEVEDGPDLEAGFAQQREELKRSGFRVGKIVGMIFMSVGMIMLAVAAGVMYSHQQFEKRARIVKGTVVDYQSYISTSDNSSTTMFTPVFEYVFKGKTYTHVNSSSSSSREFEIGQAVDIMVDPENPNEVLVNSFMEKWFLPTLLGFMGVIFTGIGYLVNRNLGRN